MKKLSKRLSVLALCLLCAGAFLFTGCGEQFVHEINWDVDLTKPITMNMLFPYTGMDNFGKDHTAKLIEDATGYHAEYTEMSEANADNEINNLLSTQKPYHVMKVSEAQFHPYVISNTWLDLTELLQKTESGRRLYSIIDLMPGAWDNVTYTDANGKKGIYGIPDCGFTSLEEFAMVWNSKHLEQIGWFNNHDGVPETLGEVTEALEKLQAKFGKEDDKYHALGMNQFSGALENFMSAFDCPNQFYIDENGDVQFYVFDDSVTKYVEYMNGLKKGGIISDTWRSDSDATICTKFAQEKSSCLYLTYWWYKPLCNAIVSNGLLTKYGMTNNYETARDDLLQYRTRVRGDGTNGSVKQEKARYISDRTGCSWYTAIPYYMAEDAVYIIDYLGKKLENFALYYGGEPEVDWKEVPAPAGEVEDFKNKIIYMKPWEYTYLKDGVETTVTGGDKWVQLTENYEKYIVDNSQYANGTNVKEAASLFHLRETGFDAWQVSVPFDETIISNPMILMPVFNWWSPISILARTEAKSGMGIAFSSDDDAVGVLNDYRDSLKSTFAKRNGVKYYYWSDDISKEMTDWYNEVRAGK